MNVYPVKTQYQMTVCLCPASLPAGFHWYGETTGRIPLNQILESPLLVVAVGSSQAEDSNDRINDVNDEQDECINGFMINRETLVV